MTAKNVSTNQWFVEPVGKDTAHANEVASREIAYEGISAMIITGDDGKPHEVWQCENYDQARRLVDSKETTKAAFELWTRNRTYGQIRRASGFMSNKTKRAIRKQVTTAIAAVRAVRT